MMEDLMKQFRDVMGKFEKLAGMENETHTLKLEITTSCRINLEAMALEDSCSVGKVLSKALAAYTELREAKASGKKVILRKGADESELHVK